MAYASLSTIGGGGPGIFHERQEGALCAVHACNNLMQSRTFSEVGMAEIGREMDAQERLIGGAAAAEASNNVRDDGFFGIQVIKRALQNLPSPLLLMPIGSSEAGTAQSSPLGEIAFLLNRNEHWYTIRKLGSYWFDLNSTNEVPKHLTDTYLAMLLQQMIQEGFTVFVVKGKLPRADVERNPSALTKEVATLAAAGGGDGAAASAPAAFAGQGHTLGGSAAAAPPAAGSPSQEDAELAAALRASLVDAAGGDADVLAALEASMQQPGSGSGGSGSSGSAASRRARPEESGLSTAEAMRRKRLARFG